MRSAASLAASLAAVLALAGCDPRVNLGSLGDGSATTLLWKATFEPGDLSEWTGDGQGQTSRQNADPPATVASSPVHRGSKSGAFAVTTTGSVLSVSYAFRNQPTPSAAYYSAWFYVPSTITVGSYLSLIHFNGSSTGDGQKIEALWDVNLTPLADGTVAAQLYDYKHQFDLQQTPTAVRFPADKWTQLEVYFAKSVGSAGHVTVWQNGTMILDRTGVATVANDWLQWEVGGASDDLSPSPAVVYVDDAAISLVRLGPDALL